MKKNIPFKFFAGMMIAFCVGISAAPVRAQEGEEDPVINVAEVAMPDLPEYVANTYVLGKILSVVEEGIDTGGLEDAYQKVLVKIISGDAQNEVKAVEYRAMALGFDHIRLHTDDVVILSVVQNGYGTTYMILDHFRLPILGVLFLLFSGLAVFLGRKRGIMSLVGLGVSLIILVYVVVPYILSGGNPLLVSAGGAIAIATTSLFLAHGFTRRTTIAFAATLVVLVFAFGIAYATVLWAILSGASTEEAVFLQMGFLPDLDLQGLLLGGLVIGVLGVLDDVTTAQVATVEEIYRADSTLSTRELYMRGLSVGREHIASLVNTLALAYVGASFPLFLLFAFPDNPPLWVILNGETITEEIVRALIGGSALILAVPISTLFAAWAFGKQWIPLSKNQRHHHG